MYRRNFWRLHSRSQIVGQCAGSSHRRLIRELHCRQIGFPPHQQHQQLGAQYPGLEARSPASVPRAQSAIQETQSRFITRSLRAIHAALPQMASVRAGISRSYLTIHLEPSQRLYFHIYHNYFAMCPRRHRESCAPDWRIRFFPRTQYRSSRRAHSPHYALHHSRGQREDWRRT
jgi:hypothetical protein